MYREEDYLQLSGLQHFKFCRRQWALIHLESQWAENGRTMEGQLLHTKAHDGSQRERRGDLLLIRDLRVSSAALGCSGACDVVEFRRAEDGVPLHGQEGRYRPFPVEYKHGTPREDTANELQLCGQAMCLEEMLCCEIPQGALYFGQTRHRETVTFTPALHRDRPGRTSLALDLMEELRPCVADRAVLTMINNKVIQAGDLQTSESGAVRLTDEGRKRFLKTWQERKKETIRHPYLEEKIPWGLVPYVQALLLARYLRGDLDAYPPFLWK